MAKASLEDEFESFYDIYVVFIVAFFFNALYFFRD